MKLLREHGLSIASILILLLWIGLYCISDPKTHLGQWFGNAIADWSGSVVIILGTKFLLERGSPQSKPVRRKPRGFTDFLREHSLLIFLAATALGWAALFARSDTDSRWGQVYGNILSEWVQMAGLVFLTKGLIEKGSPQSKKRA